MAPGSDFILDALQQEGLTHLFLVPGGLIDPFLPALARHPGLRPIVAAHEGGAAYMADGYARASGRFGAALGIGGPGLCNMATAVAAAKTNSSPVLVLSGEIPIDMEGLGEFQDASQATLDDTAVMKPLTRLSVTVASARNLDHWLRHALTAMWSQPRGPVHLSLTHDAITGRTGAHYTTVSDYFAAVDPLSRIAAEAAINAIAQASGAKIAVLAGAGVEHDNAAAALKAVAEQWSIPVATTLRAKGVFPERSSLVARRVRLCGHAPRHGGPARGYSRCAHRARVGHERARHHALDAARAAGCAPHHRSCQHRHGRAHHPRQCRPCRARQLPRFPRADAGTVRRHCGGVGRGRGAATGVARENQERAAPL